MKVQNRLPLLVISIAVIPLLILSVIIYLLGAKTSRSTYDLYLDNLTTAVALQLDDYYDTQTKAILNSKEVSIYSDFLKEHAQGKVQGTPSYNKATTLLKTAKETDPYLEASVLVDAGGNVVCASDTSFVGKAIPQFKDLRTGTIDKECAWKVEKYKDYTVVIMGAPISDVSGNCIGMIVNYLNMDYVNASIHNYKIGETGYLYVLDTNGETLSHYYENRVGKPMLNEKKDSQLISLMESLKNDTLQTDTGFLNYEIEEQPVTANYQIADSTGWAVVAAVTMQEVYSESIQSALIILLVAVVVGLLAILVGLKTANSVIHPLLYLSGKIQAIAGGDLSQRCSYSGKDEFKQLFEDVNTMADILEKNSAFLRQRASTDALTKMPNRNAIYTIMLDKFVSGGMQAAMMLDLNGFKAINDTFGHDMGDLVLIRVANILMARESENQHFSRLGGDEFFVFITDYPDKEEVIHLAEQIYKEIEEITKIEDTEITISSSIGIVFATNEATYEELMKKADTAMYDAKQKKDSVKYIVYKE